MREFIFKANKTITSSDINLKDLPGSCGRLDLLCRCVSDAFFLSHDIGETLSSTQFSMDSRIHQFP